MPISDGEIKGSMICSQAVSERILGDYSVTSLKIYNTIQSDNYSAGSAGWQIDRVTGSCEFQDATIRGTLNASDITTGTLSADRISGGTLNASLMTVTNLSASSITTGTMSFDRLSGGTMSADVITSGSLSADRISGGSMSASVITSGTLSAARIGAGTIGVEIIKLSNSASSRIESNNGTSLIIRGDGSFTATNATITGAITATSGSFTGSITATSGSLSGLTVSGSLTMNSGGDFYSASSGKRIHIDGSNADNLDFNDGATTYATLGLNASNELFIQTYSSKDLVLDSAAAVRVSGPIEIQTGAHTVEGSSFDVDVTGDVILDGGGVVAMRDGGTTVWDAFYSGGDSYLRPATSDYLHFNHSANQWKFTISSTAEMTLGSTGVVFPNVYSDTQSGTANVLVTSGGNLKRATSSIRLKRNLQPLADYRQVLSLNAYSWDGMTDQVMTDADGAALLYRSGPRKGQKKREVVPTGIKQAGMVAEHAHEAHPLFAVVDEQGNPTSNDLAAIVGALLEVVKEHDHRLAAVAPVQSAATD